MSVYIVNLYDSVNVFDAGVVPFFQAVKVLDTKSSSIYTKKSDVLGISDLPQYVVVQDVLSLVRSVLVGYGVNQNIIYDYRYVKSIDYARADGIVVILIGMDVEVVGYLANAGVLMNYEIEITATSKNKNNFIVYRDAINSMISALQGRELEGGGQVVLVDVLSSNFNNDVRGIWQEKYSVRIKVFYE